MIPGTAYAADEDDIGPGDGNNSSVETFPDLVIETLTAEPTNPEPGDTVTVTAIVKNQGTERSIQTSLAHYIDGTWIGEREIPELDPGASSQISETWTPITEGIAELKAVADAGDYITESNEWNNEKTASIEVKKQTYPDLIVETIFCDPNEPEIGQAATVTVTVKNQGKEKSGPTNLVFYIDGVYTGEWEIPDLNYYDGGSYVGTYAEEGDVPELTPESSSSISFEWTPETEGEAEIRAVVDSDDVITESDEENNEKTEYVTAKKEMFPDLTIWALSVEPNNPEPGEIVNIAVTLRNQGNERSGQTNIVFRINGKYIGERQVPELAAKSSYFTLYQWVPETEEEGWLSAKVDDYDLVFESYEGNNEESRYIIVEKQTFPDLVIEELFWTPFIPEPGETITITATVKNQGAGESEETTLAYNIDGTEIGERRIPGLGPGASSQVSFASTADVEGIMNVLVWADPWDQIEENNEWNNEKTASIEIKQTFPDLVIETLTADPANPEPGETVTVTATVKNQGVGKSDGTDLTYYVDGIRIGERKIPELDSGASSEISFAWTPNTEKTVNIRAWVDSEEQIEESDEENNEKTVLISVEQIYPDLVIENLTADPANPEPGNTVTITAVVKNQGIEESDDTDLTYYIAGSEIGKRRIPDLGPGSSSEILFTWNPGMEGSVNIRAKADAGNHVEESNEGNNEETVTIDIIKQKSPDLAIEDSTANPPNPEPEETVILTTIVKNQGTEKSDETDLAYYIAGSEIGKSIIPELDPGASSEIPFEWTPSTEGTVDIRIQADAGNRVPESDEENNEETVSIGVTKQTFPDLVIEDFTADPVNLEPGDMVTLTASVKNQGTEKSDETDLVYYIDGIEVGERIIPGLDPGSNLDILFELTPDTEGTVNIRAQADTENQIDENNEENNEKTVSIYVTKQAFPDLVIDSLTWTPEKPKPGESVTFAVTVKNTGTASSGENVLEYGIGETNGGNLTIQALPAAGTSRGTFSWVAGDEGEIAVRAVVDTGNTVPESSETNNEITKTIKVSKETVTPSSGGSGGGGGGGSSRSSGSSSSGGSKEPALNVEIKELSTRYIMYGYHVRYEFPENVTCVKVIEFDPKRTFKKTTTIVEVLKEKSIFASQPPPGRPYKNLNIWVGDKGAGNPDFLENAYIEFRVEKSWIENNGINESLITLLRYNKGWSPLETEKMGEDEQYVYLKTATPGFSPFAITEYTGEEEEATENPEEELKGVLSSFGEFGEDGVVNWSAEIEENGEEKTPIGMKKVLMAISLPVFLILVQFLVLKKRD